MVWFRKLLPLGVALAGVITLGAPRVAYADFEIDYSIDGGPLQFGNSTTGSTLTFSGTGLGGLFDVAFTFAKSNSPGTNSLALVTSSNNTITTDSGYSGTHTLSIFVSSTGFAQPQNPPPPDLSVSSSANTASGQLQVTYTGFADTSDTLFGMSGPTVTSTPTSPSGINQYSASGQGGFGSGPAIGSSFSPNGATYSLTDELDLKITGATNITNVTSNLEVTPTPAPAGLALAFTALPVLGLGGWLRRRKQAA